MSLPPELHFEGLYYKCGSVPQPCYISFLDQKPKIVSLTSTVNGPVSVFINSKRMPNTTYFLGSWDASDGNLAKPVAPFLFENMTTLEPSALSRLQVVLQRHRSAEILIETSEGQSHGYCVPLEAATAAPIFRIKSDSDVLVQTGSYLSVRLSINGMMFAFETEVMAVTGRDVALKLPATTYRQVRRAVPRKTSLDFKIFVDETMERCLVLDFSPIGICFESPDNKMPKQWDEITISLEGTRETKISTNALVVNIEGNKVRAIIGSGGVQQKEFFYKIWNKMEASLAFSENPRESWDCLREFGYLDLLEGGLLRTVEEACVSAWDSTKSSPCVFHPVVHLDDKLCGTIAAAEVATDHWVPHSLATKVDPNLVDVSAALYIGWPLYLISQSKPLWFSTWYDANKTWHNRFYQVFIREQKKNPDCFSFVRHWFWNADLTPMSLETEIVTTVLKPGDAKYEHAIEMWAGRYGSESSRMPAVALRSSEHFAFTETFAAFQKGGKIVAIGKVVNSSIEINPFSVFNCIHLNIFDEQITSSQLDVREVIAAANNFMVERGLKRCALTLDYNLPLEIMNSTGFSFFCESRCLIAQSDLLPSVMSNNALAFADIKSRAEVK